METSLKKSLGTLQLSLYGIGTIIGAGIYVLIGKVAGIAGTTAPLSFLISAVIAFFSAISYAALASSFPKSAGEVVYVDTAFNISNLSKLIGYLVLFTGIVSSATLIRGFAGYLNNIVEIPEIISMALILILMAAVCIIGISQSVWLVGAITIMEIAGLFLVIYFARGNYGNVNLTFSDFLPDAQLGSYMACFSGAFLAFFAYIGFEDLANVAEEVKNPGKSLPIAVLSSLIICTLLYVIVAVFCLRSLPIDILTNSKAPMADMVAGISHKHAIFISIISLIALINGAFVQIIMGSRIMYGMARDQLMPTYYSVLSQKFATPVRAIITLSAIVFALAATMNLVGLAKSTSFVILVVFMFVNASLFKLTQSGKYNFPKKYTYLSITGLILCGLLLTFNIISELKDIF